jgi:radical SAM superfamily enzyme YgiQ (UPF0313 family)
VPNPLGLLLREREITEAMARKVRFIEPLSRPGRPFNGWIRRWPLLGPILLASILERQGYDVAVYNENVSGPLQDNPACLEDICSADLVGLTIMTATATRGYGLARLLRLSGFGGTIAFGGVHATFCPEEAIQFGDVVVCGEGEGIICALAAGDIRGGIHHPHPPQDLDSLPPPRHELMIDFEKLLALAGGRQNYELPVMASRGCPHGCVYCSVTQMYGRTVRRQSHERIQADLELYVKRGFRRVFFYDDNLVADREWTRNLLARIEPLHIRWHAQARVDLHWMDPQRSQCDHQLLAAMRRSGCDLLYIGYETVDEATARLWNKGYRGQDRLDNRLMEDSRILHEHGIWIHAMFILGPDHDQAYIDRVVDFSRRARLETMQLSVLTPLPGTPLFQQMQDKLLLKNFPEDWDFYDGTHCVYPHRRMSIESLQRAVLAAHLQFYRSLGPAWQRLRKVLGQSGSVSRRVGQLWRHARLGPPIFNQWRNETYRYIEMIRRRCGQAAQL